jgi:hypothetical protein
VNVYGVGLGHGLIDGIFKSWEDADKAGVHYCSDLPYQYRIVHPGSLLAPYARSRSLCWLNASLSVFCAICILRIISS